MPLSPSSSLTSLFLFPRYVPQLSQSRNREDRLQTSLKMLQQHLSEERARVAELHSRLIGRSIQTDDPPCQHANSAAVLAAAEAAKDSGAAAAKAGGCPFHQGAAGAATGGFIARESGTEFAEFQAKFRATSETAVAELDEHITEQIQQRRNHIRRSSSQLGLQTRLESFKDEPPMALASLKELAMDSVQEGVTIADFSLPDQPLVYANHGFELITGYSIEETVGHNCRFLQGAGTEPEKVEHIRRCINAGLPCTVQLKNYRKNGEEFVNHLSLTPIRTARGRVTHYVGIQSDVTELINTREAELDALKKATIATAATEAKSKFLAHMSHEIRTPLNGLIAVGQLLEDTNLNRVQRDYVTTIRSSGETLQALISDILDFSRVEADKLVLRHEPFHPQAVIATVMEIVGLHSSRLKLNVGYHVDEGVPNSVMGDAMRVQQVLLNTLNNAIKFTERGDIMIRLYLRRGGDVEKEYQRAMETADKAIEEEKSAGVDKLHQAREWREEQTKRGMREQQRKLKSVDWLRKCPAGDEDRRVVTISWVTTTSRVPPPTPPTATIGSSTSTSGTPASASTRPTSTPSSSPSSRWTCHRRASTTAPDSDSPSRSACAKPWAAGCGPNPLDSAWAAHSIFASSACRYQARTARAPPRCRRCPAAFGPTRRMPSARRRLGAGFARREPPRLCPWSVPLPR